MEPSPGLSAMEEAKESVNFCIQQIQKIAKTIENYTDVEQLSHNELVKLTYSSKPILDIMHVS